MRLAVFDVDGTLIDSQHHIHASMTAAFAEGGLALPTLAEVHRVVGLTLPVAIAAIRPGLPPDRLDRVVRAYKSSFLERRLSDDAPLYPGVPEALAALASRDGLMLGIATGKGRRGLDAMLDHHRLAGFFVTAQCADDHPSKPHPAMLLAACAEAGVAPSDAAMIGDTTFDMDMALAAGTAAVGVAWGYHPTGALTASGAQWIAQDLPGLVRGIGDWAAA